MPLVSPAAGSRAGLNRNDPRVSGTVTYFSFENRLDNTGSTGGTALNASYFTDFLTNPGPTGGVMMRMPGSLDGSQHTALTAADMGVAGGASRTAFFEYYHADLQAQTVLFGLGDWNSNQDFTIVKEDWQHLRINVWNNDVVVEVNGGYGNYIVRGVVRFDGTNLKVDTRAYKVDTSNADPVGWQAPRSYSQAQTLDTYSGADHAFAVGYWTAARSGPADYSSAIAYLGVVGGQSWTDTQTSDFLTDPTPLWTSTTQSSTISAVSGLTDTPRMRRVAASTAGSTSGLTDTPRMRRVAASTAGSTSGLTTTARPRLWASSTAPITSGVTSTAARLMQAASVLGALSGLSATPGGAVTVPVASTLGSTSGVTSQARLLVESSVIITSGSSAPVPADASFLKLAEVWAAGGSGAKGSFNSGGGGGAYSATPDLPVTPGGTVFLSLGSGGAAKPSSSMLGDAGGDAWINVSANAPPTDITQGALAKGGQGGTFSAATPGTAALGGQASQGIGAVKYSGGNSGQPSGQATASTGAGGAASNLSDGGTAINIGSSGSGPGAAAGTGGGLGGVTSTTDAPPGGSDEHGGGGGAGQRTAGFSAGAGGFPGGGGGGKAGNAGSSGPGAGAQARLTFLVPPPNALPATSTLGSASGLTATARMVRAGSSTLASVSGLAAAHRITHRAASALASVSGVTATSRALSAGSSVLAATSGLAAAPVVRVPGVSELGSSSGLTAVPTLAVTNVARITATFLPLWATGLGFGSEGPDEEDDMAFEVSTGPLAGTLSGTEKLGLIQGGLPKAATVDQFRARPIQAMAAAGAISVLSGAVQFTTANATFEATLPAPRAEDAGRTMVLEMVARGTGNVSVPLTNVDGASQPNTATFTGVGQKIILLGGAAKWTVLKELGPTFS